MPNFRYRALKQSGELVSGSISAATTADVTRQFDYLRLVPIEVIAEQAAAQSSTRFLHLTQRARPEEITTFTLDLALLMKAGARLDDALDLLSTDMEISRLRSTISAVRASVLAGESFADAIARHPMIFPKIYVALVRVGEASGTLEHILQVLARERNRAETLRRKLADALRYPIFVLCAAVGVLIFFLMFVLPQFSSILHDFGAHIDPIGGAFIRLSDFMIANQALMAFLAVGALSSGLLLFRHPKLRGIILPLALSLPLVRTVWRHHRTALFCRNLDVLLVAAVPLTTTLRILAEMMESIGDASGWARVVEKVRQGGKLSDALTAIGALPAMAVRMIRLGEETGQLPELAGRVAEFYETKLQRSMERVVSLVGPLAIIGISIIVGGLILSVMTSLLSVSQLVG
jgi:general secretion pathway protein F